MNKRDFLAYILDCFYTITPYKNDRDNDARKGAALLIQLSRTCHYLYVRVYERHNTMPNVIMKSLYGNISPQDIFKKSVDIISRAVSEYVNNMVVYNHAINGVLEMNTCYGDNEASFTITKDTVHRSDTNMTVSLSEFMIPYIQSWRQ